jgi:hypothetical protein
MLEQPKDYEELQHKLEAEERWCALMEKTTAGLAVVVLFIFMWLLVGLYA